MEVIIAGLLTPLSAGTQIAPLWLDAAPITQPAPAQHAPEAAPDETARDEETATPEPRERRLRCRGQASLGARLGRRLCISQVEELEQARRAAQERRNEPPPETYMGGVGHCPSRQC